MAKKNDIETAYGTKLKYKGIRSNHPIRSRYMAAALSMILGIVGANQFYLRNVVRGILKLLLTVICIVLDVVFAPPFTLIPVVISLFTGFMYLMQSDESFAKRNHVRII